MYNSKGKTQKAYKLNNSKQNIIPKNCVAVFPLLIVSGSTYITEHGTMPQNLTYDKGSFLFWQEVFDGRSSIKIQWDGAIELEKPIGENYYLANTKVGKYFFGKPISNSTESLDIGEDASFDEFITMKSNQTITLRFEFDKSNRLYYDNLKEDLRFVDNDLYKLYLIPELCEGKLMYISDYEEIYNDETGLSWACEITFQSLGNELQKSGKAVEQYPQWSAPGEFYVKPKIEYSTGEKREKRIIIDPQGLHPKPIKHLQVELQGPALTSCIYALGRRQERDEATGKWKIGPSKHLLGSRFITTQPNPLNRTSTPSKNFNCYFNEEVVLASTKEALEFLTSFAQPLEQMKNGGFISLGRVSEWKGGDTATGIHLSNDPTGRDNRYDYFDETWFPLENINFGTEEEPKHYVDYNTNGCVYCEDTMRYDDSDTMIDIMNKNVFTFNQQPIIPLSMFATRPLYLKNIPIVGAIANFFNLGDIHLFTNTKNRQASNLIFFGDSDLCSMCAVLQKGYITSGTAFALPWRTNEQKVAFPINFFGNNQAQYNKLGVNSVNTTLCIELTDKINMTPSDLPQDTYDTLWLAQSTKEDGTPFYPSEPNRTLLTNSSMKAQILTNNPGFIIDTVIVQTIFDGKIRISAYSTEDDTLLVPEWTTTILSNANWQGGAMRDWTNMYFLSNWTERFCRQQDEFTYPLAPRKTNENEVVIPVDFSENFKISNEGTIDFIVPFTSEWSDRQDIYKNVERSFYTIRNKPISDTYTVQYLELGIPSVRDKESFKAYFGDIQANFQQSRISYVGENYERQIAQLQTQFKTIGSFGNEDTYTFELPILSINNNIEGWEDKELEPWCDSVWKLFSTRQTSILSGSKLGTTLKPTLTITLRDNDILFSMVDNSLMIGWNNNDQLEDNFVGFGGGTATRWVEANYTILLNSIKFLKKEVSIGFSNSVYGKTHN